MYCMGLFETSFESQCEISVTVYMLEHTNSYLLWITDFLAASSDNIIVYSARTHLVAQREMHHLREGGSHDALCVVDAGSPAASKSSIESGLDTGRMRSNGGIH
jgi:hypothetical protein